MKFDQDYNLTQCLVRLPEESVCARKASPINGWSDHYGAISLACDYARYPTTLDFFVAFWQHGCFGPWETKLPGRILYNNEVRFRDWRIFVARKDEESYLHEQGYSRAKAIGLPFVYLKECEQPRHPKSLLILPTHSLKGFSVQDRGLFTAYVNEVLEYRNDFNNVVACVHPSCFENGFWVDEFRTQGIPVIKGADNTDENALFRMKTLFSTFEYVTTNGWGSHIPYALSSGAKVSLFGSVPEFSPENYTRLDQTWQSNDSRLKEVTSGATSLERERFLAPLRTIPGDGKGDVELGRWLIGFDNKLSPCDMKKLLQQAFGHSLVSKLRLALLKTTRLFKGSSKK